MADPGDIVSRRDLSESILEEYVPGTEFSAETFSTASVHSLVAVVEKHTSDQFIELGRVVPAPSLSARDKEIIAEKVPEFLTLMGITDGPAHTVFKYRDDSVVFIQSLNRIGGGRVSELIRLVTGVDLTSWSLGWPLGIRKAIERPRHRAAAVCYAMARTGTVAKVEFPEHIPRKVDVEEIEAFVRPGETVGELDGASARVGCVMVTADDPRTALASARKLANDINVIMA